MELTVFEVLKYNSPSNDNNANYCRENSKVKYFVLTQEVQVPVVTNVVKIS